MPNRSAVPLALLRRPRCWLASLSLLPVVALLCAAWLPAQTAPATTPSTPPATAPQGDPRPKPVSSTTRLPEVVISESTDVDPRDLRRTPLDNPAARDILSPEELRQAGATNTQELLRRSPNIFVTDETGSDSLPNIAVRGLSGNEGAYRSINLAMFADGIPLAPAPYGHPGSSLFALTRDRIYAIDVQRGGASVRYGPNNVSGIVNYLTRPIPQRPTLEGRFRYDTFEDFAVYSGFGGTWGPFGVLLESVVEDGQTCRENGDYTLQNHALKTSYAFSPKVRGLFQLEYYNDDSDLADGLSLAAYNADPKQSQSKRNRFSGQQVRANYKLEWQVDADTRADLITYYYDGERTFFLGSPVFYGSNPSYIQTTPRPMRVWAVQPQLTHRYTFGEITGELCAGVRYLQEDIERIVERFNSNGTYALGSRAQFDYYTASAFLENTIRCGDWTVTPGIRFEYVVMNARNQLTGFDVEKEFTEVLPALGASYLLREDWSVYANAQTCFSAPQAVQIEISNNPQDISAQYAWVYELGTRAELPSQLLAGDLCVYWIDYQDRLEQDPDQLNVYVNNGRSRHRGVELGLDSDLTAAGLPGLTAWSSVAYNDSVYTNGAFDGNHLPASPPWLWSWGTRYLHERSGLWAAIDGFHVDAAYSDRENTVAINANGTRGVRPSYTVWNAHVGCQHQLTTHTRVEAQASAKNLFDDGYFEVRAARGLFPGVPFHCAFELGFVTTF